MVEALDYLKFERPSNLTDGKNITRQYYFDGHGSVIFEKNAVTVIFGSSGFDKIATSFQDSVINNGRVRINNTDFGKFKYLAYCQTSEKIQFTLIKNDT